MRLKVGALLIYIFFVAYSCSKDCTINEENCSSYLTCNIWDFIFYHTTTNIDSTIKHDTLYGSYAFRSDNTGIFVNSFAETSLNWYYDCTDKTLVILRENTNRYANNTSFYSYYQTKIISNDSILWRSSYFITPIPQRPKSYYAKDSILLIAR